MKHLTKAAQARKVYFGFWFEGAVHGDRGGRAVRAAVATEA